MYEMPFGLIFRKAVLWHESRPYVSRNLREGRNGRGDMQWEFSCSSREGLHLDAAIDGSGTSLHRVPYAKTNCKGTFEVSNNSFASASLVIRRQNLPEEKLETRTGAVLEMVG